MNQHPPRAQAWTRPARARVQRLMLLALSGMTVLATAPALAGSVTAESIWDKRNALQRAQSQLPVGSTVTRTQCTEVNVRTGNYRYICTLFFTDPPAGAAATPTAPTPSAPSAPAP
jgi:hypothetical protein